MVAGVKYSSLKRVTPFLVVLLLLNACGYRPVKQYTKNIFGNSVYVKVHLSQVEPQNGVFLKDEIIKTVQERFDIKVVKDKNLAESTIFVPYYHFSYSSLSTDENGYVTRYRISTKITFNVIGKNFNTIKKIRVSEDVGVKATSLTSSIAREIAIRYSIRKAMDKLIASLALEGIKR